MSQLHVKSPKHCAAKQGLQWRLTGHHFKKLFFTFSTLLTLFLSLILLVWLILRPSKPLFSLKQAEVYRLDLLSSPHLLNSSLQLTLLSSNPNSRVGIYYDDLSLYASYHGQQITADSPVPPFYQGQKEANLITASLVGSNLPVATSFPYEVARDQTTRRLALNVKANARIRWKVGTWVSGRYRLNVNCLVVMDFGPTIPSGPVSTRQGSQCTTIV
ncbi:NDR1/HIN1-like protein 26 [Punica granatum]|uniref:Late embryogenesis abundant protein LEA-2 subgroup domain-containing protein n=2 Tax=Punica granatum TaxID=22663 RepID=A0A218WSN1_PUNGR|nr:NDR1/HIN1-like protein 26 [Punica granatum]OWM75509.1 hypothetical protein CDL15_Pgr021673 [Punica granatum]PKI35635.1 hypothetical protein CRG98_044089 [Punica granatum]